MRNALTVAAALIAVLALAGTSQASLMNLTPGLPDIFSANITVNYDAASDLFSADGQALQLTLPDLSTFTITGGVFYINMTVGPSGVPSAGTVSLLGTIPALGATSGTLATGAITAFGYSDPPGGEIFEFVVSVTLGDLLPPGAVAGVILDAWDSDFNGTFDDNFANTPGLGVSDAFVPEPATLAFFAAGMMGLALRRRPSRARQS
jgi:hypothetical protein